MPEWGVFLAGQQDVAVANHGRHGGESLMQAGTPDAQAVGDAKQGAVQRALYHIAVPRQELVTRPVERGAGMGTGVYVGVNRPVYSHQT